MAKKEKEPKKAKRREIRLKKARQWVLTYEGADIDYAYCEHFKVDPFCAVDDLSAIGALQLDELTEMKYDEQIRQENMRIEWEARQELELQEPHPAGNDFFIITGYTPDGAPCGVTWNEIGIKPYEPLTENSPVRPQKEPPKYGKLHGHYCKICGLDKPSEQFSDKGHAAHVCRQCESMSAKEQNDKVTLCRIKGMALYNLSEFEIDWLRKKMKDADSLIKEAARIVHDIKFPHYYRSIVKKGLTVHSLEFFIRGTVLDENYDEVEVNTRFFAYENGAIRRISYDAPHGEREASVNIGRREAVKFLKAVVQQLNAPFWSEDYGIVESGDDFDCDNNFEDELEDGKSAWSLHLMLNGDDETTQTSYGDYIQDNPQNLYWLLMEWFGLSFAKLRFFYD